MKSQFVISSWGGSRRAAPYAFTEQRVAMLSSVLRSPRAVKKRLRRHPRIDDPARSEKETVHWFCVVGREMKGKEVAVATNLKEIANGE